MTWLKVYSSDAFSFAAVAVVVASVTDMPNTTATSKTTLQQTTMEKETAQIKIKLKEDRHITENDRQPKSAKTNNTEENKTTTTTPLKSDSKEILRSCIHQLQNQIMSNLQQAG